jgi:predicted component of type VI protein secretion system
MSQRGAAASTAMADSAEVWKHHDLLVWLAVRDDFRNWLQLGLPARERA